MHCRRMYIELCLHWQQIDCTERRIVSNHSTDCKNIAIHSGVHAATSFALKMWIESIPWNKLNRTIQIDWISVYFENEFSFIFLFWTDFWTIIQRNNFMQMLENKYRMRMKKIDCNIKWKKMIQCLDRFHIESVYFSWYSIEVTNFSANNSFNKSNI